MASRKALITLSIGNRPEFAFSHHIFRRYAERYNYDFVIINERKIRYRPYLLKPRFAIHLEKYQLYDIIPEYDRVVYLDSDVLISSDCPDLAEVVDITDLGCAFEDVGDAAWKRREEMIKAQTKLGPLRKPFHGFFNAGVMVLSEIHRELFRFDPELLAGGRWPDQTSLNYHAVRLGYSLMDLGQDWITLPVYDHQWQDRKKRCSVKMIHYAGIENKHMMEIDYATVENSWIDSDATVLQTA